MNTHVDKFVPVQIGEKSPSVKLVQEWLCLRGLGVKIDGDYGPATAAAVHTFGVRHGLWSRDANRRSQPRVTPNIFDELSKPLKMVRSIEIHYTAYLGYAHAITFVAQSYLSYHPREVGGQNRGPWVRHFMDGKEGVKWPWCAGAVKTIDEQAAFALGKEPAFNMSYHCDTAAARAAARGRLYTRESLGDRLKALVKPAWTFLLARDDNDGYQHTGKVIEVHDDHVVTIEGNTNDDGEREGYEMCQRVRSFARLDFIDPIVE